MTAPRKDVANPGDRVRHEQTRDEPTRDIDGARRAWPRWVQALNLLIFLAAVAVIGVALNFFAARPPLRAQIDATKTRAYSLSDQTTRMLQGLPAGRWTIAMVVSEANVSRPMRKQIDEVLRRYTDASSNIRVLRIDPDDPRTITNYEALLRDLQAIYRDDVAAYEKALDAGVVAFKDLQAFAQQHAAKLAALAAGLPETEPLRKRLEQSAGLIGVMADQGNQLLAAVTAARRVNEAQPIADFEGARSILATSLTQWANESDAIAGVCAALLQKPGVSDGARQYITDAQKQFEAMSRELAIAADPLRQLPVLDLGEIGRQLGRGEAAVILGPERATVIPSNQLLPKSNLKTTREGGIAFDQRFRGEQLLSAAIRSLTIDQMPLVVFVHAENASLLSPRDKQADVTGVSAMLKSSRYEVMEWDLAKSAERPPVERGRKAVWVIVPPPPARSVESSPAMRGMFNAIDKLIIDGESVLLSVSPSLLAKYGQPDPFAVLPEVFGVRPDTGTIIFESVAAPRGETQVKASQEIDVFSDETAIGRAVDGQQAEFGTPVPVKRLAESDVASNGVTLHTIAAIEPAETRWLESDWTGDLAQREPRPEQRFDEPLPVAVAAERMGPSGAGDQRFILIGSGGWMLTNVADPVVDVGGGRVALVNPGNHELMLASVAWLAGMDDLIAASPLSQEVSRLRGITPQVRGTWWWIIVVGVPLLCLLLGGAVWLWRRA